MTKVTLTIDDKKITVDPGLNLIQAAQTAGIEIPHYCYHPGLSIDGNCRMCLVKIDKMPKPMIACNTFAADGMVVFTKTPEVENMRKSVMEFLLINHPLDCPTCDQAGECRLQDYYMQYDEIPSRFAEGKVHKDKMIDLGAGVMLDQERCIACTRCIRVCQEVAKVDELTLANRSDHVTITTFPGRELSNPYAGNTVDVCPVGALTSRDFRYKKRVWLLKSAPSVCPGCSRGCNIRIDHADSHVYRLVPRHNPDVNKYWMCDEGRGAYKFVNDNRILRPHQRVREKLEECDLDHAYDFFYDRIRSVKAQDIGVVLHAFETNENLDLFFVFAKNILGTSAIYFSHHAPANPTSDDILRTADKNPNRKHLEKLKIQPLDQMAKNIRVLLVLHDLAPMHLAMVKDRKISILALFASHQSEAQRQAEIIFPVPTYAEQDGSFTNVDGRVQKISKAFEPRGESLLIQNILADLGMLIAAKGIRKGTHAKS